MQKVQEIAHIRKESFFMCMITHTFYIYSCLLCHKICYTLGKICFHKMTITTFVANLTSFMVPGTVPCKKKIIKLLSLSLANHQVPCILKSIHLLSPLSTLRHHWTCYMYLSLVLAKLFYTNVFVDVAFLNPLYFQNVSQQR